MNIQWQVYLKFLNWPGIFCLQFDMGDVMIDGQTTGKYTPILVNCLWSQKYLSLIGFHPYFASLLQAFVVVAVLQLLIQGLLCWLAQLYVSMCVYGV